MSGSDRNGSVQTEPGNSKSDQANRINRIGRASKVLIRLELSGSDQETQLSRLSYTGMVRVSDLYQQNRVRTVRTRSGDQPQVLR